jgi:xylan 1,4-beta-xylosidase
MSPARIVFLLAALAILIPGPSSHAAGPPPTAPAQPPPPPPRTFANPLNLDYRFTLDAPSRREAADPVIVLFGDAYYLFASKSGGYWRSSDLADWTFVKPEGLPIEAYAPAVMAFGDALYYSACDVGLYRSRDPKGGKWEHVGDPFKVGDPDLFADDDGRVYLYYGLSYNGAISGMELDPRAGFRPLGAPFVCFRADYARHGWERRGDDNLGAVWNRAFSEGPWIEGAWMTKHAGVYYLQYAAPGTEFKSYADGVYTAPSPRGPFTYAPSSPFSSKPTGFIGGAGHSATFRDKQGHYWHIATMTISVKHMFERRLGLFPADFDAAGTLHVDTALGDYPQMLPALRADPAASNRAGMMLLSYGKPATASSSLDGLGPERAFDEDIKTYWSARSAERAEWLSVDLGKSCRIQAVQVNFAEHEATQLGRSATAFRQYRLEASASASSGSDAWTTLTDRGGAQRDTPHDYVELANAVEARQVRLTNLRTPGGGTFSVRDLRIFGACPGAAPALPRQFEVHRDASDPRSAVLRWDLAPGADGYLIRYGVAPGKLYQAHEVRGRREVTLHGLNAGVPYHFTIDAFNESGLTTGTSAQKI